MTARARNDAAPGESIIRPARAGDEPALHRLAARTFPLACPPGSDPADERAFIAAHLSEASFAGYLADRRCTTTVVDRGDELLGYSLLVGGTPEAVVDAQLSIRPSVQLNKFYVAPECHGDGVAARLMARTLEVAARGYAGVWLGVNAENARALRFYARQGFERVGRRRFGVGDVVYDDHLLERPLP